MFQNCTIKKIERRIEVVVLIFFYGQRNARLDKEKKGR